MTGSTQRPVHSTVRLDQPGDLIAAVPHLLGFHPSDSLVVVGLRGPGGRLLGLALRADLPPPLPDDALAEQLCRPLTEHNTVAVVLVVVGACGVASGGDAELPGTELLSVCEEAFARVGIPVVHRLWTPSTCGGAQWRCYDGSECAGTLPDPRATALAAASAVAGVVTYASRDDIAATLEPLDAAILARRAALLERASRETEPDPDLVGHGPRLLRSVHDAIERAACGAVILTDDEVVRLADALSNHWVRDACLVFDDARQTEAAGRLWTALVRATPSPECAEPACLLALHAYLAGDGVLAGIALERAAKADPGHRLTSLLRDALLTGLPPARLREAVGTAAAEAREQLAGEPT